MKPDLGKVDIDGELCKGCGLCVESCTPRVLGLSTTVLNRAGYRPAIYGGRGCTGCGLCFFACPEPGVLTVYKLVPEPDRGDRSLTVAARKGPDRIPNRDCQGAVQAEPRSVLV